MPKRAAFLDEDIETLKELKNELKQDDATLRAILIRKIRDEFE